MPSPAACAEVTRRLALALDRRRRPHAARCPSRQAQEQGLHVNECVHVCVAHAVLHDAGVVQRRGRGIRAQGSKAPYTLNPVCHAGVQTARTCSLWPPARVRAPAHLLLVGRCGGLGGQRTTSEAGRQGAPA